MRILTIYTHTRTYMLYGVFRHRDYRLRRRRPFAVWLPVCAAYVFFFCKIVDRVSSVFVYETCWLEERKKKTDHTNTKSMVSARIFVVASCNVHVEFL